MVFQKFFYPLFIGIIIISVGHSLFDSDLFVFTKYILEIILISISLEFVIKGISRKTLGFILFFIFYSLLHFTINPLSDIGFYLKICGYVFIFLAGVKCSKNNILLKPTPLQLKLIIGLPIIILALQKIAGINNGEEGGFSIFDNSNNYAFFVICCTVLIYLSTNRIKPTLVYLLSNFIVIRTIGALFGVLMAIVWVNIKKVKAKYFAGLLVLLLVSFMLKSFLFQLPVISRANSAITVGYDLIATQSIQKLSEISYGEVVSTYGTEDLSFLFRIKQWSEIFQLQFKKPVQNWIFGSGLYSIRNETSTGKDAHNDYLLMLYELGLLGICFFVVFIYSYFRRSASIVGKFLLIAISIYFISENLLINFVASLMYFFLLGMLFYSKTLNENSFN